MLAGERETPKRDLREAGCMKGIAQLRFRVEVRCPPEPDQEPRERIAPGDEEDEVPILTQSSPEPAERVHETITRHVLQHRGRYDQIVVNPAVAPDLALFTAVLRGEHTLQGFRKREVRTHLFGPTAATDRGRSAQVSRLVKRLHLRGLVAKVPRSRRWRVTRLGHAIMSTAFQLHEDHFPGAFLKEAA